MRQQTSVLLLLLMLICGVAQAQLQYPNPPPYTGTNPSLSDIRAKVENEIATESIVFLIDQKATG